MLELFLWMFVFVVLICWLYRGEPKMTWYIIFRVWYEFGQLHFDALDAVESINATDAMSYGRDHYQTQTGEYLRVEPCLTKKNIKRARALHQQHTDDELTVWTPTYFIDWMSQPAYDGNQDKYLRSLKR
jgi:hypothetical protein